MTDLNSLLFSLQSFLLNLELNIIHIVYAYFVGRTRNYAIYYHFTPSVLQKFPPPPTHTHPTPPHLHPLSENTSPWKCNSWLIWPLLFTHYIIIPLLSKIRINLQFLPDKILQDTLIQGDRQLWVSMIWLQYSCLILSAFNINFC